MKRFDDHSESLEQIDDAMSEAHSRMAAVWFWYEGLQGVTVEDSEDEGLRKVYAEALVRARALKEVLRAAMEKLGIAEKEMLGADHTSESRLEELAKEFENNAKYTRAAGAKLPYKHQRVKTQHNMEASTYEECARRLREVLGER